LLAVDAIDLLSVLRASSVCLLNISSYHYLCSSIKLLSRQVFRIFATCLILVEFVCINNTKQSIFKVTCNDQNTPKCACFRNYPIQTVRHGHYHSKLLMIIRTFKYKIVFPELFEMYTHLGFCAWMSRGLPSSKSKISHTLTIPSSEHVTAMFLLPMRQPVAA
jgi:hypothetical protein